MSPHYDFSEPMVEEVLTDLADNFFSSRKELDDMIDIFYSYLIKLREKEAELAERAGFLNWLLINGSTVSGFYELLGMNPPAFLTAESRLPDRKIIPEEIPFAFTAKGEFVKTVIWAYNALQKACQGHMNGYPEDTDRDSREIYYKMMLKMSMLINKKIADINTGMSPYSVLGFARKFNPEARVKECVAGATLGGYACSIDSKLAYQPIDFESLNLKTYPELPEQRTVLPEITSFCEKNYAGKKDEIRKRIADLKRRIRIASGANRNFFTAVINSTFET